VLSYNTNHFVGKYGDNPAKKILLSIKQKIILKEAVNTILVALKIIISKVK